MGKWLYDRGAATDASKDTVQQFMKVCPPFRALIYAMMMSWYNFSVRDPNVGERFNAGANDQYMSIYLPYCDKFVTAEARGGVAKRFLGSSGIDSEQIVGVKAWDNPDRSCQTSDIKCQQSDRSVRMFMASSVRP